MGKRTARSFCELGTFVFLLYFAKVPSVSSVPTGQSIMDVMKTDKELSKVPIFLYESNVTKICSDLKYPDESVKLTFTNVNSFLCLALYDTLYKACDSSQLQKSFNNVSMFYSYIQKFFPAEDEESRTMFCKNVKDVVFSYKKLQPLLSHARLNHFHVCNTVCFNMDDTFNPLCAVLAWSKSIDDNGKEDDVSKGSIATEVGQKIQSKVTEADPNKSKKQGATEKDSNVKDVKDNLADNNQGVIKSINVIDTSLPKPVQKSSKTPAAKSSSIINPDTVQKQETTNNNSPPVSKQQKEVPIIIEADNVSDNVHKSPDTLRSSTHNVNNGVEGSAKDANDDVKTSTLSENTQDHDTSANQEDWNHAEDEKLPFDSNDGFDQPIDTGDQNQNMPEPSEQRDIISHYHSIRSDEESHFFTYFTIISLVSIAAYIGYHNKQKILAIVLEGRRARNSRGRRRPSTANYRKLDCTLEEAVTSQCNANVTHVIY